MNSTFNRNKFTRNSMEMFEIISDLFNMKSKCEWASYEYKCTFKNAICKVSIYIPYPELPYINIVVIDNKKEYRFSEFKNKSSGDIRKMYYNLLKNNEETTIEKIDLYNKYIDIQKASLIKALNAVHERKCPLGKAWVQV